MHDIGAIVWIILVLIGVFSSLRRSARRVALRGQAPAAPPPQPPPASVVRSFAASAGMALPPVIPPPVPVPPVAVRPAAPRPVAAPPAAAAPTPPVHPEMGRPIGTSPIRGMFEGPATLVRAIVAAEVLGPPKSMQEQTIWSPRHSEPSI
jgi:hypothetical protein